ncbi:MAG: hypothetical protein AB7K71_07625 [Polyangiaceae bacterium]
MNSANLSQATPSSAKRGQLTRRVGIAACAGIVACSAACALPALLTAVLGAGAAAGVGSLLGAGSELLLGGSAFVIAFAVTTWLVRRIQRQTGSACAGASCALENP